MRVKVKMVIDGSESIDDRLQAPGVLLDGGHGVHQALRYIPGLALCGPREGAAFSSHTSYKAVNTALVSITTGNQMG